MTPQTHIKRKKQLFATVLPLFCIAIAFFMLAFGEEIKKGVSAGIGLSFANIIPTLFPFFILSDLWSAVMQTKKDNLTGRCLEAVFNIDR